MGMPRLAVQAAALVLVAMHVGAAATSNWTKLCGPDEPNAPARREGTILQVLGDSAYIYGGLTNTTTFDDTWKFDLVSLQWTQLDWTDSPGYRFDHVAVTHGTDMYVFGGSMSNSTRLASGKFVQTNDLWKLNSLTDEWTPVVPPSGHPLPPARAEAVAVTTGTAMVVFGGVVLPTNKSGASDFNDVWEFQFDTQTWREVVPKHDSPLPVPRFSHAATAVTVGGLPHMVVFSGRHIVREGWAVLTDAWMLSLHDVRENAPTWTLLSVSPVYNRLFGGAVTVGSSIWMFGGFAFYSHSERDGLAYSDTVATSTETLVEGKLTLYYDYVSSNEEDADAPAPHARFHHAMGVWRDQVLVYGGKFLHSYGDLWLRNTTIFPSDPNPYQPNNNVFNRVVFVFVGVFWISSVVGYLVLFVTRLMFPPFIRHVRMMPPRPRGLSTAEITAFQLVPFEAQKEGGADVCSICLTEFEPRELLRQLSCRHRYHPTCIDTWLAKSQACPLCKRHLASPKASSQRDVETTVRRFVAGAHTANSPG